MGKEMIAGDVKTEMGNGGTITDVERSKCEDGCANSDGTSTERVLHRHDKL